MKYYVDESVCFNVFFVFSSILLLNNNVQLCSGFERSRSLYKEDENCFRIVEPLLWDQSFLQNAAKCSDEMPLLLHQHFVCKRGDHLLEQNGGVQASSAVKRVARNLGLPEPDPSILGHLLDHIWLPPCATPSRCDGKKQTHFRPQSLAEETWSSADNRCLYAKDTTTDTYASEPIDRCSMPQIIDSKSEYKSSRWKPSEHFESDKESVKKKLKTFASHDKISTRDNCVNKKSNFTIMLCDSDDCINKILVEQMPGKRLINTNCELSPFMKEMQCFELSGDNNPENLYYEVTEQPSKGQKNTDSKKHINRKEITGDLPQSAKMSSLDSCCFAVDPCTLDYGSGPNKRRVERVCTRQEGFKTCPHLSKEELNDNLQHPGQFGILRVPSCLVKKRTERVCDPIRTKHLRKCKVSCDNAKTREGKKRQIIWRKAGEVRRRKRKFPIKENKHLKKIRWILHRLKGQIPTVKAKTTISHPMNPMNVEEIYILDTTSKKPVTSLQRSSDSDEDFKMVCNKNYEDNTLYFQNKKSMKYPEIFIEILGKKIKDLIDSVFANHPDDLDNNLRICFELFDFEGNQNLKPYDPECQTDSVSLLY